MDSNGRQPSAAPARRVWSFGRCSFDEARWSLMVEDRAVEIEAKPLDVLIELLEHAGEVVTKDELLDAVWPGVTVVEGSLPTAISKLRKALGEDGEQMIVTVPRIGYRFAGPVSVRTLPNMEARALPFAPGMALPDRPHWHFVERLGLSTSNEVWRIQHEKTRELRVMKFASDPRGLRALKREVALSRLMQQALGDRPDLIPVLDWDFGKTPCHIESNYGGPDLVRWAQEQGGLAAVPLAVRLELIAKIAGTVAAAHGIGILHKDLKPGNVLVAVDRSGVWQSKVVDFGSAVVTDASQLDALGVTHSGSLLAASDSGADTPGTRLWMAPEQLVGSAPTTASDLFALGVMLYQIVVGDFRKPFAPGWESDIADPLLREDIASAAAGDPQGRMDGPAELARRLRSLDERRVERDALAETEARAQKAEARLLRIRARRPWLVTALTALVIGILASGTLYVRAARERDRAEHQTQIAERINLFLANDLLARSNPFRSSGPEESLVAAVKSASPLIDRRFAAEPAIAARLHQTIANALDRRSDWDGARAEYGRAVSLWTRAAGPHAPDTVIAKLQTAMMEARSYKDGSLQRAKRLLTQAHDDAAAAAALRPDTAVWLASAQGMLALVENDTAMAAKAFGTAVAAADQLPSFDAAARLTFRQRLAFVKIRQGDGAGAEKLFRKLHQDFAAIEGPDGPNVLMIGMNLTQALMVQGRHAEAVAQANALYPIMKARLGDNHEMTLQLVTTRAQSEGILERWDDSIRDDLAVHAAAVAKQGAGSFFAIASLSDAATAQCRAGRVAEGLGNARQAHAASAKAFGKAAVTDATAYAVAACEIAAGDYDHAAMDLQGIDRASVSQLAADANWGANVDLALAQIALARHKPEEARRYLVSSAHAFQLPNAEPYQVRTWQALDRAARGAPI